MTTRCCCRMVVPRKAKAKEKKAKAKLLPSRRAKRRQRLGLARTTVKMGSWLCWKAGTVSRQGSSSRCTSRCRPQPRSVMRLGIMLSLLLFSHILCVICPPQPLNNCSLEFCTPGCEGFARRFTESGHRSHQFGVRQKCGPCVQVIFAQQYCSAVVIKLSLGKAHCMWPCSRMASWRRPACTRRPQLARTSALLRSR